MRIFSYPKVSLTRVILLCLLVLTTSRGTAVTNTSVVVWGAAGVETNIPVDLTNVVAIAAGTSHIIALRSDGRVTAWGQNAGGQTVVPTGLSNVVAIAAGDYHNIVLKTDGTVISWGQNMYNVTNVPANLSNVVAISAGGYTSVALKNDGTMVAWGQNSTILTNLPKGLNNVSAIAAGGIQFLALQNTGTVLACGSSSYGVTNVPAGLNGVQAIAAGANHNLALLSNRTVVAWGNNSSGQTNVPALLSNSVAAIAASPDNGAYSLALNMSGAVVFWGNSFAYRGGNTNMPQSNVVAIAASSANSAALLYPGAPIIVQQPTNQTAYAGTDFTVSSKVFAAPPLSYQWQSNGTNIPNATNSFLTLVSIPTSASGNYSLMVSNLNGSTVSSNFYINVQLSPPVILTQPVSQYYYNGSNATFTVGLTGTPPYSYQWQFNGTDLYGATNSSLVVNMQPATEGFYNLVVTNAYGSVTSAIAQINMLDIANFLNATNFYWSSTGTALWYYDTNRQVVSCGIFTNGNSALQTTTTGPGTVTFNMNSHTGNLNDYLLVTRNGATAISVSTYSITSNVIYNLYLGDGTNLVKWTLYNMPPLGERYPFIPTISQFSYSAGTTPAFFMTTQKNLTLLPGAYAYGYVLTGGTPPLTYQWSLNGVVQPQLTNNYLQIPNIAPSNFGDYSIVISNAYAMATNNFSILLTPPQFVPTLSMSTTNGFQLGLTNVFATNSIIISASTNLVDWVPVYTNPPATGTVSILDPSATNYTQRFYRATEQ